MNDLFKFIHDEHNTCADAELMWYVDYLASNPGIASSISRRSCDLVDKEFNSRKYMTTMEDILTEVARKASSPA
jgi:GrpB-like predicted nucleotidyltransferase (UPF0157 family)